VVVLNYGNGLRDASQSGVIGIVSLPIIVYIVGFHLRKWT